MAKLSIKILKEYYELSHMGEIAVRYFGMNLFDGILTILGIILAEFYFGIQNTKFIVSAGIGAAVAMAISGIWGAYLVEHAERKKELKELERATLTKLKKTKIGRASRAASISLAIIDGLSPLSAILIILIPFFFSSVIGITIAFYYSIGIAFLLLFLLGVLLGRLSKESAIKYGLKTLLAGIVCAIVLFLIR